MKFKNINSFQEYLRENGAPDTMTIDHHDLIMNYYDQSGHEIDYRIVEGEDTVLTVETSNRYGESKFSDAICTWVMSPELD